MTISYRDATVTNLTNIVNTAWTWFPIPSMPRATRIVAVESHFTEVGAGVTSIKFMLAGSEDDRYMTSFFDTRLHVSVDGASLAGKTAVVQTPGVFTHYFIGDAAGTAGTIYVGVTSDSADVSTLDSIKIIFDDTHT